MEGKSAVCRFCSGLAWSGMDILLYGMITERLDYARGRAQKYHRWRGEDGEGEGRRAVSGEGRRCGLTPGKEQSRTSYTPSKLSVEKKAQNVSSLKAYGELSYARIHETVPKNVLMSE